MEFLPLSRRRSSSRNVPGGEERGETDVFAGYSKAAFTNAFFAAVNHNYDHKQQTLKQRIRKIRQSQITNRDLLNALK